MKKNYLVLILCLFSFILTAQKDHSQLFGVKNSMLNVIDSIKIIPAEPSASEPFCFTAFSDKFRGDCTYRLWMTLVLGPEIAVYGIYDSNNECMGKGANDTIYLGYYRAGIYTVIYRFIDISGHVPTETYTLQLTISEETKLPNIRNNKYSIYPNPCNSYMELSFSSNDNENKHIQLFDVFGKLLFEEKTNKDRFRIDMTGYNRGIYLVKVSDKGVYKIIKE